VPVLPERKRKKMESKLNSFGTQVVRTYEEEKSFIEKIDSVRYRVKKGYVPGMNVSSFETNSKRWMGCFMLMRHLKIWFLKSWNNIVSLEDMEAFYQQYDPFKHKCNPR
jgi:hypothetical protein